MAKFFEHFEIEWGHLILLLLYLTTFEIPVSLSLVECDGFGALNHLLGGTKDSQITASSSHIRDSPPYSAKLEEDLSGWTPLRGSGEELQAAHFIQIDLRYPIQTKFVVRLPTLRVVKLESKPIFYHINEASDLSI